MNSKPPVLPTPSNTDTKRPFKYIPTDVRQEKIVKGLCYYCDKPYDRNHKCNFRESQLFTVEIAGTSLVDDFQDCIPKVNDYKELKYKVV